VETKILSEETLQYLSHLHWSGNVRQLENVCHWLTVMAPGQNIDIKDLPPELKNNGVYKEASADWKDALKQEVQIALSKKQKDILAHLNQTFEKILIEEALHYSKGRRIEAAEILGLGRNTLTRKIKELKIEK
jgi:two-component system nitrogen regulation response regulator GlnG